MNGPQAAFDSKGWGGLTGRNNWERMWEQNMTPAPPNITSWNSYEKSLYFALAKVHPCTQSRT